MQAILNGGTTKENGCVVAIQRCFGKGKSLRGRHELVDEPHNLALIGETVQLFLRKDELVVDFYFKDAAARFY